MLLQCYCHAVAVRLSGCLSVCLLPPSPCFFAAHSQKKDGQVQGASPWAEHASSQKKKDGQVQGDDELDEPVQLRDRQALPLIQELASPERVNQPVLRDAVALTGQEAGAAPSCSTERALFGLSVFASGMFAAPLMFEPTLLQAVVVFVHVRVKIANRLFYSDWRLITVAIMETRRRSSVFFYRGCARCQGQ